MCSSVVEYLPSVHKAQDSSPVTYTSIQHPSKNRRT